MHSLGSSSYQFLNESPYVLVSRQGLWSEKISWHYHGLESVVNLRLDTISWCGILVISQVKFWRSESRVFTRLAYNCSFLRDLDALAPDGA